MKNHSMRFGVHQKLNRAGVVVVRRPRQRHGGVREFLPNCCGQSDGRRYLDNLLMAALDRAIAFVQMQNVAVPCRR